MKLSEFWHISYLPWAKKSLKASSLEVKVPIVQKFILPRFGQVDIGAITEGDVESWHEALTKLRKDDGEPYSQTYLRTIHNQLVAILGKAVEKRLIIVNPAISLGSIGSHDAHKVDIWTPEEYGRLITKVGSRTMRLIFNLAFWCSLRRKEILSLAPEDVDDDGHWMSISIPRPVNPNWTGTPVVLSSPFERRKVDIPIFMQEDIRDARDKAIAGRTTLFPYSDTALSTALSAAADDARLRHIGFDGLRDSSICLMIEAGFTASDIARHTGTSLQALERRFSQYFDSKAGFSERLVDHVFGMALKSGQDEINGRSRTAEGNVLPVAKKSPSRKMPRANVAIPLFSEDRPRIFPSNQKKGLHAIYSLDQIPVQTFATWCGLYERSRKMLAASGLSMLKLVNTDAKTLQDTYRLPPSAIQTLKEAFDALGIREGITRSGLRMMGRYTFEDFAGFRNRVVNKSSS